jgi:hypothetical protein
MIGDIHDKLNETGGNQVDVRTGASGADTMSEAWDGHSGIEPYVACGIDPCH